MDNTTAEIDALKEKFKDIKESRENCERCIFWNSFGLLPCCLNGSDDCLEYLLGETDRCTGILFWKKDI